jgi:hypothetical protein
MKIRRGSTLIVLVIWIPMSHSHPVSILEHAGNTNRYVSDSLATDVCSASSAISKLEDIMKLVISGDLPKFTSAQHVIDTAATLGTGVGPEHIGLLRTDTDVCKFFLREGNPDLAGVGVRLPPSYIGITDATEFTRDLD